MVSLKEKYFMKMYLTSQIIIQIVGVITAILKTFALSIILTISVWLLSELVDTLHAKKQYLALNFSSLNWFYDRTQPATKF